MGKKGDAILERARAHFAAFETQSIEVPEWAPEDGSPFFVYWKPLTLKQKSALYSKARADDMGLMADVIIYAARDEEGAKLFWPKDRDDFLTKIDPDVTSRIASAILSGPESGEDSEKN